MPVRFTGHRVPEPPFHLPPIAAPESRSVVAGAWAGLVAESLLHPFDTVSTRLKAQSARSPRYTQGFASAARTIAVEEGVRKGLFGGIGATMLFAGPATALYFGSYEAAKAWGGAVITNPAYVPVVHMGAGFFSELAAAVVVVPQEVVKSRMQLGANPSLATGGWLATTSNYRNTAHALASIVRAEGVLGLYAGARACVSVDCCFGALQFTLYEYLKSLRRLQTGRRVTDELSAAEALGAGAVAGALAGFATNPLDVVSARLMVQGPERSRTAEVVSGHGGSSSGGGGSGNCGSGGGSGGCGGAERVGTDAALGEIGKVSSSRRSRSSFSSGGSSRRDHIHYRGVVHCYQETVRREGARALWNGAVPRVLSIAPVVAIQFAVYEAIKDWLGIDIEEFDFDQ